MACFLSIVWPAGDHKHAERERGFCLLKGIAEGTYNSKHAEAARLYYTTATTTTTTHIHTHTYRALSSDTLMNVVAIPIV